MLFRSTVASVVDRQTYEITADIPGVAEGVRAYPFSRGEMDEPVSGNTIYLICVDPVYHSFYLYTKAKSSGFIGIRSNGKLVKVSPDDVTIGVYGTGDTNADDTSPDPSAGYIKIDSSGNIDVMATGNETIKVSGDSKVEISGNCTLKVSGNVSVEASGNADIKASGSTTINSPNVTITGGMLKVQGQASLDLNGPFCGIKNCIFSGVPHCGSTTTT